MKEKENECSAAQLMVTSLGTSLASQAYKGMCLYSSEKLAPLIVEAGEIIAILTATVKRLKARRDN